MILGKVTPDNEVAEWDGQDNPFYTIVSSFVHPCAVKHISWIGKQVKWSAILLMFAIQLKAQLC